MIKLKKKQVSNLYMKYNRKEEEEEEKKKKRKEGGGRRRRKQEWLIGASNLSLIYKFSWWEWVVPGEQKRVREWKWESKSKFLNKKSNHNFTSDERKRQKINK